MTKSRIATQIRLDEEIHAKLKYIAETELRSLNAQMEYFILGAVEYYEQVNGTIHLPEKK